MKSLTTLVRSLFLSTALATLPTVYSCGEEEDRKACVSDTECKGDDRICVGGKCEYSGGKGDSGEGEEGPCGNSPMYGKWLWEVSGCEHGLHMKEDCRVDGYLSDDGKDVIDIQNTVCTYQSTRLQCSSGWPSGEFKTGLRYENSTRINELLAQHNGYVLVRDGEDFDSNRRAGNAWIPLDEEFSGHIDCTRRFGPEGPEN